MGQRVEHGNGSIGLLDSSDHSVSGTFRKQNSLGLLLDLLACSKVDSSTDRSIDNIADACVSLSQARIGNSLNPIDSLLGRVEWIVRWKANVHVGWVLIGHCFDWLFSLFFNAGCWEIVSRM